MRACNAPVRHASQNGHPYESASNLLQSVFVLCDKSVRRSTTFFCSPEVTEYCRRAAVCVCTGCVRARSLTAHPTHPDAHTLKNT